MDLPALITSLFDGVVTGVLVPILQGMYGIAPGLGVIAVIAGVITLIFAERKAAKLASIVVVIAVLYLLPNIPDLITALMDYGVTVTGAEAGAAVDAAREGVEAGANAALDAL